MVKAVRSSSNHKSQACSVIGTTVWKPGFTTVEDQALVSQGEGGREVLPLSERGPTLLDPIFRSSCPIRVVFFKFLAHSKYYF